MEGFNTKLIGSLFADNLLYEGGLDPRLMIQLAKDGECDGFLIDTLTKDGRNLFDFIPEPELREMILHGKELGRFFDLLVVYFSNYISLVLFFLFENDFQKKVIIFRDV